MGPDLCADEMSQIQGDCGSDSPRVHYGDGRAGHPGHSPTQAPTIVGLKVGSLVMPRTVSPTLLRIVAEAASSCRSGKETYVVASMAYPYDREVFHNGSDVESRADAERFLDTRDDRDEWMLFGPYVSQEEGRVTLPTVFDYRVTIERKLADGTIERTIFDQEIDALFLTLPAIDKFAVPYYTSVVGAEEALALRDDFIVRPGVRGHDRKTRWLPPK